MDSQNEDYKHLPCKEWTESHVSSWLKDIGVKTQYIQKLNDGEVTGPVLLSLEEKYLRETIGMGSGQIQFLLSKRAGLTKKDLQQHKPLKSSQKHIQKSASGAALTKGSKDEPEKSKNLTENVQPSNENENPDIPSTSSFPLSRYRKFDEDEKDFKYMKHSILPPETGVDKLIVPCHEYKSLENASKLDARRLKIKFASEVIRFACGCMNMRTNGTIHFGVMDKTKTNYKHGEVIGIPIKDKETFVDALDYIENSFLSSHHYDARECIRSPKFIEVTDKESTEQNWVIEVDIVPMVSIVRDKLYRVRIPKFNEKANKTEYDPKTPYQRVGSSTSCITDDDLVSFIQALKDRDLKREQAESNHSQIHSDCKEDLGRKLSLLLTGGKKYMDNTLNYIIVTNKFDEENLKNISFLAHMNILCVFDFDPESKTSGLCQKYQEYHTPNPHFLQDYANDRRLSTTDFVKSLQLFDRKSWIFCNGRTDYFGDENPCDEKSWVRTKKKLLKRAVSVICNEILPKGSFIVVFLLMSEIEQPLVDTFHEFYAEMNGHEDVIIISESVEIHKKWSNLAQASCSLETLEQVSIVGMSMSHVDATVQSIQLSKCESTRCLPVFSKGLCFIKRVDEDNMFSLEIVSADQCDETNLDMMDHDQISELEQYFYRGGKIDWLTLWLADKGKCGEVIQRDAYAETDEIVETLVLRGTSERSVENITIYHHPGSGGSTVARQILWKWRKKVRCAVVKHSHQFSTVCEHATKLREYGEKDKNSCLPVILLLEDYNADYLDDLRQELSNAAATMKISPSTLCFIILSCKRSHEPQRMCKSFPSRTAGVTHKLSDNEKKLFSKKAESLKLKFEKLEFILTFVLMSEGFQESYITDFVQNLLDKIDHSSPQTQLIKFVSLLNSYVQNSFLSVSHCETFLGLGSYIHNVRYQTFESSLSEQAKLIFIHLRDSSTHISAIRIIHPLVAKEILNQLSAKQPQSTIAMDLLQDKALFDHRFGRDDFLKFNRDLFIKRNKKSRGDPEDTLFSPLIEHVCNKEDTDKAIDLLKTAYTCLGQDAFVAQQLARVLYKNKRFSEAQHWAGEAKSRLPHDTFILDTEGQVYKRWFYDLLDALDEGKVKPEAAVEIIDIALKGIKAFRASEKAPKSETVGLNNSYFGEVDVGCQLLKLLKSVDVFSTTEGNTELMRYLLTDYIPETIKKPWSKFHGLLKGLKNSIHNALECICDDLAYFQIDLGEEEEEHDTREPEQIYSPRKWLMRRSAVYAEFFCDVSLNEELGNNNSDVDSAFTRQMKIYKLGGGNAITILSLLSDNKKERAGEKLEELIGLFPANITRQNLDQSELEKFIFCQIGLACAVPGSGKLLTLGELQDLSMRFCRVGKNTAGASAHFLLSLLFWPEDQKIKESSSPRNKVLMSAIDVLHRFCETKARTPRKARLVTHFFLGKAPGLNKIIHRSTIEKLSKGTLSERRLKWLSGEVWTNPSVMQLLKRVEGWTENGNLFVQGTVQGSKIRVIPLYSASLPNGNENVTFYLGFSFHGVVAFDIKILE
ncbi:sterile alpha motif domain-containing protein 9-like [Chanos chanos]|uniref:Sterile alpha motif domain-containing protein 9-like n=1 Tax=Chanos chanos TaxID=29144 RepID=A0A6J2WPX2_CHACN|nr:sterile alpha motif domain-containing protein 9-like [Chanos chanos]